MLLLALTPSRLAHLTATLVGMLLKLPSPPQTHAAATGHKANTEETA